MTPVGRAADPAEIAEVVAFLASDCAGFMVVSVVMADGGMSVVIQLPAPAGPRPAAVNEFINDWSAVLRYH